ncbi:auxin-responsive protein SAUR78-like [Mercurialis annua]|uniref:auxin-responsive protein SAUR78-like n=1 Tax=Mercurialis annua TaxID=3986 RepID=UPI00215EBC9A|nr:auxin-responsive protein SAUR78-like [Mercurialis annua]
MAKTGKLTKLKSAIKRWPSLTKLARSNSSISAAATNSSNNDQLREVYVGKSRRRYLLSGEIICHPLFQEMLERSGGFDGGDGGEVVVSCEVVLFEHLLWMLQTSGGSQLGSMEELAEFYCTC